MARSRRKVRRMVLDGSEVVVLDPGDYEVLEASRRQVGALQNQIARLNADLARVREEIELLRHNS